MDSYTPLSGTPVEELDTPCLLVDLDVAEQNFRLVADTFSRTTGKMRQHTKNVKSPVIARMQIRAGGTVNGVCTAKVAEAEVMVESGITDILIANQVVSSDKIGRLCGLARQGDIKVCVDNPRNVRELSEIAAEQGVAIGVLIEVNTSMGRAGVRSVDQGVALAKLAVSLPGIAFKGVMSHQSLPGYPDKETRVLGVRKFVQKCLDVKDAIEAAGIPVEMVSSGETWSYDAAATMPGVTEVEGGTYALMGTRASYMKEFQIANKVLTTVISTPRPGVAVGDVGTWALAAPDGGLPSVEGMPGVTVEALLEEHIVLKTDGATPLALGDKVLLLPWHQDMLVNRWDRYVAVRKGVVEAVWPIPGRGCFH